MQANAEQITNRRSIMVDLSCLFQINRRSIQRIRILDTLISTRIYVMFGIDAAHEESVMDEKWSCLHSVSQTSAIIALAWQNEQY